LRDLNVKLIGVHGLSFDFTNGSLCITKAGSHPGLPGSWVDPPGRPGLAFFAFTGLSPNPNRSSHQVDPPGRSGFNNYGFIHLFPLPN
jgi:hypothetical protein